MKKMIYLLAGLAFLLTGCSENTPSTPGTKPTFDLIAPRPSWDSATLAATVTATSKTDEPVTFREVGFSYRMAGSERWTDYMADSFESNMAHLVLGRLTSETTYEWKCYAYIGMERFESSPLDFTTLKQGETPPVIPTFGAPTAQAETTTASLSCTYLYDGDGTIEEAGFRYRATAEQDYTYEQTASSASPLTVVLGGLAPQTGYEFAAYVMVDGELFTSTSHTFTTKSESGQEEPQFGTLSATGLSATSATLNGSFTYGGTESIAQAGFEYRPTAQSNYTTVSTTTAQGNKNVQINGLTASTAYAYRLYVVIDGRRYQSGEATFTTSATGGDYEVYNTNWAELPVEGQNPGEYYYAHHITDVTNSKGYKARNYSVCYSKEMMCAVWVAAPMHTFYSKKNVERTDAYKNDPTMSFSQPGKWSGYTRGHMLGSAERLVSDLTNRQVFYHTNIAPQLQTYFNTGGGAWNNLEDWVDTQWSGSADTTYQVIGSYWENGGNKTVSGTRIPTHYYKVLLRTKNHQNKWVKDCSRNELQCVAIMVEHRTYSQNMNPYPPSDYADVMSVADLEKMTGLTFFPNVPNAPKDTFSMSDWSGL